MGKTKIETPPGIDERPVEQEKTMEEKVGKKFDEIFDLKKYRGKLKIFGEREKEKIKLAIAVFRGNVINAARKGNWEENNVAAKITEYVCENVRDIAEGEGIDGKNRDNFVSLIKEMCQEIKTSTPNEIKEPEPAPAPAPASEPEIKIVPEEKPEPNLKPAKPEAVDDFKTNNQKSSFKHILTQLEKNFQSRLKKVEKGEGEKDNMKINPKIYLDNLFGVDWDSLQKDEQDEITRRCEEYNQRLSKLAIKRGSTKLKERDKEENTDAKKTKKPEKGVKNPSQKDFDFFEAVSKTKGDKKTYVTRSVSEDALEEQGKIENLKETEKKKKIEIYEEFGRRFWKKLLHEADWEGYSEENKQRTLEIQASVFLANEIKKNGDFQDKNGKILKQIIEKITKDEKS